MSVRCYIDSIAFSSKPDGNTIGNISNRITKHFNTYTITEIVNSVNEGKTILPFEFKNNIRSKFSFKRTNLILLDFDNRDKVSSALKDCLNLEFTKNNASFYYESFNSSREVPKFRLGFVLDFYIESASDFKEIYSQLLLQYPTADMACNDCARLFFGGRNAEIINENPKISKDYFTLSSETFLNRYRNVELLSAYKRQDVPYIQEYFSSMNITIPNSEFNYDIDLILAFNKFSMYSLFELPEGSFKCILEPDDRSSCSIMKLENGDYIYKRFSLMQDFTKNNFQLLKALLGVSYNETLNFLLNVFKVVILSRQQKDLKINTFISAISQEVGYPNLRKLFKAYKSPIKDLLTVMFNSPITIEGQQKYLSMHGYRHLAKFVYGATYTDAVRLDTVKKKITKILHTLAYVGLIRNLKDEDLPQELLRSLNQQKYYQNKKTRTNVYEFIESVTLEELELNAKRLVDKRITISTFKADIIILVENSAKYKEINVQSEKEKITPKLLKFRDDMSDYISKSFEQGRRYIIVKELVEHFL